MAKRSREKCEGRGEGDGQRAARERRGDDGGSEEVTAGGREDGDTLKIIETENGDLESEVLTKAQKKELKKLKNLEWKWHRGENDPNPRHTEYYRQQLPELQEEWALFQETMAKDLPVTFRLCTERNRLASSILKSRLLTEVSDVHLSSHLTQLVSPIEGKVHGGEGGGGEGGSDPSQLVPRCLANKL